MVWGVLTAIVSGYPMRLSVQKMTSTASNAQLAARQSDSPAILLRLASRWGCTQMPSRAVRLHHIRHAPMVTLGEYFSRRVCLCFKDQRACRRDVVFADRLTAKVCKADKRQVRRVKSLGILPRPLELNRNLIALVVAKSGRERHGERVVYKPSYATVAALIVDSVYAEYGGTDQAKNRERKHDATLLPIPTCRTDNPERVAAP